MKSLENFFFLVVPKKITFEHNISSIFIISNFVDVYGHESAKKRPIDLRIRWTLKMNLCVQLMGHFSYILFHMGNLDRVDSFVEYGQLAKYSQALLMTYINYMV